MGGDTGKIIGYVALAAAVAWTAGAALAPAATAKVGAVGAGKAGTMGFGGTIPAGAKASSLGSLAPGYSSAAMVPAGGFSTGAGSSALLGGSAIKGSSLATPALYTPSSLAGGITSAGTLPTATASTLPSLGSLTQADPTFWGTAGNLATKAGSYVAENPLSSYFLGSGIMNQAMAQTPGAMPQMDFSSLQNAKTYDQTLDLMTIDQLNSEMQKPNLSIDQRNSIGRAMQRQGLSNDRIYEAQMRGQLGAERTAGINQAVQAFNDSTNVSQEDIDADTALLLATYNNMSDEAFDKAETDRKQQLAQVGRLASQGGTDAFGQIAQARADTHLANQQRAEAEILRRNKELAGIRKQGVDALMAGANYGDVQDRWNANYNENNRRYQLGDINSLRDSNYNTALLGVQGANNYNTAKYTADRQAANAQATQGLEMAKLGMRGFGDLIPANTRYAYDSIYS